MKYYFETYGCQMNSAESAALALVCKERDWQEAEKSEDADLILLNTCSVRQTAEQRVLGRIADYSGIKKKRKPPFTLVIAGCMAQRLGETLKSQFPQVDYVMGTNSRSIFPLILEAVEKGEKADIDINEKAVFSFSKSHFEEGQFRSFIPIMHGCDNFCSYCIVPYVRGREVSRDPDNILEEIRLVASRGVREITLLGQNVNSYEWQGRVSHGEHGGGASLLGSGGHEEEEKDNQQQSLVPSPQSPDAMRPLDFADLLKLIAEEAKKTNIKWIRFLSANPKNFSSKTIEVLANNPVFCRHIHLPVQHGSTRILRDMNRGYTARRFLELVREIRTAMPGITLSTDIMVGFPGETEDDVRQTLDLMEEIKFLYSYMYHFNPREGTKAYDLPNRIDEEVKRERLAWVIALQQRHTNELLKARLGSEEMVFIEGISRKNADELITRTEKDEMAVVPRPKSMIGSFAMITISSLKGNTFRARDLIKID